MNKILLLAILFSFGCKGQNNLMDILPIKEGKVNYTKVLEVEGVSKEKLYKRAKHWLTSSYEYPDSIIQTDDSYQEIMGLGNFKVLWGPNDYPSLYVEVFQTINIKLREGRYQYEITNFIIKKYGMESQLEIFQMNDKKNTRHNKLFYENIDQKIKELISSLENSMSIEIKIE